MQYLFVFTFIALTNYVLVRILTRQVLFFNQNSQRPKEKVEIEKCRLKKTLPSESQNFLSSGLSVTAILTSRELKFLVTRNSASHNSNFY